MRVVLRRISPCTPTAMFWCHICSEHTSCFPCKRSRLLLLNLVPMLLDPRFAQGGKHCFPFIHFLMDLRASAPDLIEELVKNPRHQVLGHLAERAGGSSTQILLQLCDEKNPSKRFYICSFAWISGSVGLRFRGGSCGIFIAARLGSTTPPPFGRGGDHHCRCHRPRSRNRGRSAEKTSLLVQAPALFPYRHALTTSRR